MEERQIPPASTNRVASIPSSDAGIAPPSPTGYSGRWITLQGVHTRNLKGIDVRFPSKGLIGIVGVSGAGKSSLAFETIAVESQRRFIETIPTASRRYLERMEQPPAEVISEVPPAITLRRRLTRPSARETVATISGIQSLLQQLFARFGQIVCPDCQLPVQSFTPQSILESLSAMQTGQRCLVTFPLQIAADQATYSIVTKLVEDGFQRVITRGNIVELTTQMPIEMTDRSSDVVVDRIQFGKVNQSRILNSLQLAMTRGGGRCALFLEDDTGIALSSTSSKSFDGIRFNRREYTKHLICIRCNRQFEPFSARSFSHRSRVNACPGCQGTGLEGDAICPVCQGFRLKSDWLAVRVNGLNLGEVGQLNSIEFERWLTDYRVPSEFSRGSNELNHLIPALKSRLRRLIRLGLGKLQLGLGATELPGFLVHRLAIANVCESRLVESLFLLDDPGAGIHSAEIPGLLDSIWELVNRGNCVVLIGNTESLLPEMDWILELGPGAGKFGGRLIAQGSFNDWKSSAESQLASKLSGQRPVRNRRNEPRDWLEWNIEVSSPGTPSAQLKLPLGSMCVVSGSCGSPGWFSARNVILTRGKPPVGNWRIDKSKTRYFSIGSHVISTIVIVDQYQSLRTDRANLATWAGLWNEIRQILAESNESQLRQFTAGTFSLHNSNGGRCKECEGRGELLIDMQFLPDVRTVCPECRGAKFQRDVLEVKYRGRNAAELLDLTVLDALTFFRGRSRLQRRLLALKDVGLGYVTLGQSANSLSNGEVQRLRLARHVMIKSPGPYLFLVDEPSAGLHPLDIQCLIGFFDTLLAQGHSLILFDNHPDFISAADWNVNLNDWPD